LLSPPDVEAKCKILLQSLDIHRFEHFAMPTHRLKTVFLIFQFATLLYEYRRRQQRQRTRRKSLRARKQTQQSIDDDALLLVIVQAIAKVSTRRCWAERRSKHWIAMVIHGETLQGREFESTFRMTRNSFEQLHAALGIFFLSSSSDDIRCRAVYHSSRYQIQACNAIENTAPSLSTTCNAGHELPHHFESLWSWAFDGLQVCPRCILCHSRPSLASLSLSS